MSQTADFLNRRERTSWHVRQYDDRCVVTAEHAEDLNALTWKFPKSIYAKPVLEIGSGRVLENDKYWLVAGNHGKILRISIRKLTRAERIEQSQYLALHGHASGNYQDGAGIP
jgi:hypothetical protein